MPTFVADELVTASKLNAATARDWAPWTPTLTGITQGNGTVVARYVQVGKLVACQFEFTFGASGSAMGTGIVSLPVTATSAFAVNNNTVGTAIYSDASPATTLFGWVRLGSTTTIQPLVGLASGTYVAITGTSSTIPFTWASGDVLAWTATYEAA